MILWLKIMLAAKELQKTHGQGKERQVIINTQEDVEPALAHTPPYNGMALAAPATLQCPVVKLSGVVDIDAAQPADAETAKSNLLVKAADNALNGTIDNSNEKFRRKS